jgi:polyisoprenoid-binding protein YceI
VRRFDFDPETSQVWIDGSSSVHPIRAAATGVTGWIELGLSTDGIASASRVAGEVHIAVDRLASGNALVDRETRHRINATRYPEIVGSVTAAERIDSERWAVTGDITFRGEVRSVSGELVVSLVAKQLIVEGTQTFDVREWGLQPPRIGFLRVHPDVRVRIHAVANADVTVG